MVQMSLRNLFLAACCFALGACANSASEKVVPAAGATICKNPRPQVCTMDYRPVCATFKDGSAKTYSNGCGACTDTNVTFWVEDACPE